MIWYFFTVDVKETGNENTVEAVIQPHEDSTYLY